MEQELDARLKALEEKLDRTFMSAERTRRYILVIVVVTVVAFVLPLIGLIFAVPAMLAPYADVLSGY